jgi:14-3-3 protein epsilon
MSEQMAQRERLVYKAKLAEQAERYKEMKEYMSEVAKDKTNKDLSTEERNLLSVAFKNVIGSRRASWRVIQSIADSETDDSRTKILDEYRTVIETEIETICAEILEIIDGLVENSEETEPKVFYLKMKGDYLRYLAEFQTGPKKDGSSEKANEAYAQADQHATNDSKGLPPTDPIRLGLALNVSIFIFPKIIYFFFFLLPT